MFAADPKRWMRGLSLRIAAPLARKGHQLFVRTLGTAYPHKPVRKDAAFEKCFEFVFDKLRQARRAAGFDLGEKRFEMFLHQAIQRRFFGTPPLVVDRACRCGAPQRWAHERRAM